MVSDNMEVEISTATRASHLRHKVQVAVVLGNEILTAPGVPEKRYMQLKLPTSLAYEAGDYLALLPMNNMDTVSRVLRRFGLPWDAVMMLKTGSHSIIPIGTELAVSSILAAYVELHTSASRKNIDAIASWAEKSTRESLLAGSDFEKSSSILDVLETYPSIPLPFGVFLSMQAPTRIRQYSISSSPLHDSMTATVTYSIPNSGSGQLGVATNCLKSHQPGSVAQIALKKSQACFHLPLDESIPIIMACAGSGLVPFRGFVEERVGKIEAGNTSLGKA